MILSIPSIPEALEQASTLHRVGRLKEAEELYRQILDIKPDHADSLHLLGVIAHQRGRSEKAVDLIGDTGVTLRPRDCQSGKGSKTVNVVRKTLRYSCFRRRVFVIDLMYVSDAIDIYASTFERLLEQIPITLQHSLSDESNWHIRRR